MQILLCVCAIKLRHFSINCTYLPQNLAHCEKSLSCSGDKYYYGPLKNVSRLLAGCYSSSSIWLHHFPKAIEMTSSSPINTALLLLFLYYYTTRRIFSSNQIIQKILISLWPKAKRNLMNDFI